MMSICCYDGYLRNRPQLLKDLGLNRGADRREDELSILSVGYHRWGREIVNHLNGGYAFAIRDEEQDVLFCARDPLGIERFYYCLTEDGTFLFGTDLRTIVRSPHYRKALDKDALQLYLMFGYPVGERTLYQGVLKLMPGCTLVWDGKKIRTERYYKLSFESDFSISEREWTERIDATLQEILSEDRANFDFSEAGSFLSGGVDSSYLLSSSGVRDAYGIGFADASASEIPAARAVAEGLGARFHESVISAEDYFRYIPHMLRSLELPLADACAPAFALGCKAVSQISGVFLSGEGADEFFAGYHVYSRCDALGAPGAAYYGCDGVMEQKTAMALLGTERAFPMEELTKEVHAGTADSEPLSRMLAADIALWLEGDILFGVGNSARSHGMNLLLPYADSRMFALSAAIPSALKRKDGTGKYILRKAAEARLGHEVAFRPKKGFPVPIKQWLRQEPCRFQVEEALFGPVSRQFFDQALLKKVWDAFLAGNDALRSIPYAVYVFVLWYINCFAS